MIYMFGSGATAVPRWGSAATYLEGHLQRGVTPMWGRMKPALKRLFTHSSPFPRAAFQATPRAECPGSIHGRGAKLGYSLSHAFGAVLSTIRILTWACVIGDGRGGDRTAREPSVALETSSSMPPTDGGRVLPILHLNGYKIANPTILARHFAPKKLESIGSRPARIRMERRTTSWAVNPRSCIKPWAATARSGGSRDIRRIPNGGPRRAGR